MSAIYVPSLPPAIYYMENYNSPPWKGCRGVTLMTILGECGADYRCDTCRFRDRCVKTYEKLVDSDKITWKGAVRHVARYFK
jgi:hypothetical protein